MFRSKKFTLITCESVNRSHIEYTGGTTFVIFFAKFRLGPIENTLILRLKIPPMLNDTFAKIVVDTI